MNTIKLEIEQWCNGCRHFNAETVKYISDSEFCFVSVKCENLDMCRHIAKSIDEFKKKKEKSNENKD